MKNKKNLISALILLGGIPVIMAVGFLLFGGKQYAFISAGVAVLSCVPFFMFVYDLLLGFHYTAMCTHSLV